VLFNILQIVWTPLLNAKLPNTNFAVKTFLVVDKIIKENISDGKSKLTMTLGNSVTQSFRL
jgi:hypothetical protein